MPRISPGLEIGSYRTVRSLPDAHEGDLIEPWLCQIEGREKQAVLTFLRMPHQGLDREHKDAYARFRREVEVLRRLRHPGIVTVYPLDGRVLSLADHRYLSRMDVVDEDWWFWLGEHLEGGALKARMEELPRLPLEEAAEVVSQLAEALDYLHSKELAHLLVSPKSIFLRYQLTGLERRLRAVLTNFTRVADKEATIFSAKESDLELPLAYLAPERIRPARAGATEPPDNCAVDVYGLGVLLYHLLAGELPFTGDEEDVRRAILAGEPNPMMRLDVPAELRALIAEMIAPEPSERPSLERVVLELDKSVPPPRRIGRRVRAPEQVELEESEGLGPITRSLTSASGRGDDGERPRVEGVRGLSLSLGQRLKSVFGGIMEAVPGPRSQPRPKPVRPEDGAELKGTVTFEWQWKGQMDEGMAFELRVWKEGQSHDRAGDLRKEPSIEIDLDSMMEELPGEEKTCRWAVAVVRKKPYASLSEESAARAFTYVGAAEGPELSSEDQSDSEDEGNSAEGQKTGRRKTGAEE